jgi:hyperosmotically inducible periplasmic protein
MKNSFMKLAASAALAVLCSVPLAVAQASPQSAPDNSQQNQNHTKTADSQPNTAADRATTAKVRKAIVEDKGLSTYAHNVKIITMNGQVTLKGPVKSEEEKQTIASKAAEVAGSPDKVNNQLSIKQ